MVATDSASNSSEEGKSDDGEDTALLELRRQIPAGLRAKLTRVSHRAKKSAWYESTSGWSPQDTPGHELVELVTIHEQRRKARIGHLTGAKTIARVRAFENLDANKNACVSMTP